MKSACSKVIYLLALVLLETAPAFADWSPGRNVDLVVGAGAGGGIDITARVVQKILRDKKIVTTPVAVVNKPGGGGALAWNLIAQRSNEADTLAITVPALLTNSIRGISQLSYKDVTPIVQLLSEYTVWSVRDGSPIKTGKDLIERLKADPASVTIAVGSGLGGPNHLASAMVAKVGGVDVRGMKFVVLQSSMESITSVLGGHVDVVASSPLSAGSFVTQGKLRAIASSSPQRISGAYSNVPTWKEMGINVTLANWRGIIGPKGMTVDQVAFWENAFLAVTLTEEWRDEVEKNLWTTTFSKSADSKHFLDQEDQALRKVLNETGMIK